jgi:FdhD protein
MDAILDRAMPTTILPGTHEIPLGGGGYDVVADEAPLEIQLATAGASFRSIAVVLRSRVDDDDDLDLAVGFLCGEGIVGAPGCVERVSHCTTAPTPDAEGNVVQVRLREGVEVDWERLRRHTFSSSSCGVCGKATIEAVCALPARPPLRPMRRRSLVELGALTDVLLAHQPIFSATGAVHAAMLVDDRDTVVVAREDVGRHNAVDKVIGRVLRHGDDPAGLTLVVSGRVAFEIVQKAVVAGLGGIVAVGGATSLATELATRAGLPLVGFVRGARATWYVAP